MCCRQGRTTLLGRKIKKKTFLFISSVCSYKSGPETADEPRNLLISAVGSVTNLEMLVVTNFCDICSFVESNNIFGKRLHELRRTDVLRLATYKEELYSTLLK